MGTEGSATVGQLLAALTPVVFGQAHVPDPQTEVTAVRVFEPSPKEPFTRGDLVVAIGVDDGPELLALLAALSPSVAGVAAKCGDAEVEAVCRTAGIAVLFVTDDVDWLRAVDLLQAAVRFGARDDAPMGAALPPDLFELCDLAVAALGGPVTIEDESGTLLAYSRDQKGGDEVRVQTLIARRSPARFTRALSAQGIPQALARTAEPLIVTGVEHGVADRVGIALRAGTYRLGHMWVLVTHPTAEQLRALSEIAAKVSLQLMRRRSEDALARRLELEQLAVLLHGGASAASPSALPQLAGSVHWVAAIDIAEVDPAARAVLRARVEQRLALAPRGDEFAMVGGQLSNLLYLILSQQATTGEHAPSAEGVGQWLGALLRERDGSGIAGVHTGIGRAATSAAELPRSRREAEQALAVARTEPQPAAPVSFDRCWAKASLQRALDPVVLAELEHLTPLRRLRQHDRHHSTEYVSTLAAWLRCQGNVRAAATALHIHTNTLRYRMDKLCEVGGIDLADSDARLVLALQLWPAPTPGLIQPSR